MPRTLFTIVVPCYNHALFLEDAVRSLAAQDVAGLEVIIVNDGSTDKSQEAALALKARYPSLALRVLRQTNQGPAEARNAGIRAATRPWIVALDADDILADGFLAVAGKAIAEHPGATALTGAYREFGARESGWRLTRFDPERLKQRGNIVSCSPFRKTLWEKAGGFDPSNPWGGEDWHFWIKALEHGLSLLCLPVAMLHYRIHQGSGRVHARRFFEEDFLAMHYCMLPDTYPEDLVLAAHEHLTTMQSPTEERLRRRIALFPRLPLPHFWLGLAHEGRGEHALAQDCYVSALAHAQDWSGAWQVRRRLR